MSPLPKPVIQRLTRRSALSLLSAGAAGAVQKPSSPKPLPRVGEFVRFLDDITETPVFRLTSLNSANFLPARENRAVSVKGRFLVFSSDRTGPLSPFRLDLRTGQVIPLLSTTKLDATSISLDNAGKLLLFLDENHLKQFNLTNKKMQVLSEDVSSFSFSGAAQGTSLQDLLLVRDGKLYRPPQSQPLAQDVVWCQARPGGGACLFTRGGLDDSELWYLSFHQSAKPLLLSQSAISNPCWSFDGRSALFLRNHSICEVIPESSGERRIGGTSQFVAFSPNADNSVFVGAVRSKAQPTINLLLRNPAREFTLCEHKASHPELCAPVFSADSRHVYFNSDFQGKPAIYSVNVEALIEQTPG